MEKLLNIDELAEALGVARATVYDWTHDRKIPFIKVGRRVMFRPRTIEKWLKDREVPMSEFWNKKRQ